MGNRLSKIYTRTGDDGSTGLADGNRIAKNAQRVEAMGTADELNCHIGILVETLLAEDALIRSEEHTSELQSRPHLVCRLLLEKKKHNTYEYLLLAVSELLTSNTLSPHVHRRGLVLSALSRVHGAAALLLDGPFAPSLYKLCAL